MRHLMLIGLPCLLTACSGSTVADVTVPPPASLTTPCARPVALAGAMSQAQVEKAWGRDRSALRACGKRLEALASWGR